MHWNTMYRVSPAKYARLRAGSSALAACWAAVCYGGSERAATFATSTAQNDGKTIVDRYNLTEVFICNKFRHPRKIFSCPQLRTNLSSIEDKGRDNRH
jgi:hypothetical protein